MLGLLKKSVVTCLKRAPSIRKLQAYGGRLTIEQYRADLKKTQLSVLEVPPGTNILPVAWQLWTIDKSQEIEKFLISTRSMGNKTKNMTELGTVKVRNKGKEQDCKVRVSDSETDKYSEAMQRFKAKRR